MTAPVATPLIQAVVVLYRCAPGQSAALGGLLAAMDAVPAAAAAIDVLVYDNSPEPQSWPLPAGVQGAYEHDGKNGALLSAYNAALRRARQNGAEWLLLLDQDTAVTLEFMRLQLRYARELSGQPSLAASVPHLRSAGVVQSPHAAIGWKQTPLSSRFAGHSPRGTTAFNSGAMLRRSAIESVGGFPAGYRLDFLDHAMFARLARGGFRLWILPVTLDHPMTWEDPVQQMSVERFAGVLAAEQRFHREYGDASSLLAFRLRCARRAWRIRGTEFARICWRVALGLA